MTVDVLFCNVARVNRLNSPAILDEAISEAKRCIFIAPACKLWFTNDAVKFKRAKPNGVLLAFRLAASDI